MANASLNDPALVAKALGRCPQLVTEVGQVGTADVPQFHPLQVIPDPLVGIEIGCVAGQPFQMEAFGPTAGQEVLDRLPSMDGRAVPDHQQLAGEIAQQMAQKPHHILALERPLRNQEQELAVGGDPADGREVILGQGDPQDGRLAPRRVAPHAGGEQIEAGFVYPNDGAPFPFGFFLSAGQRSVSQVWMAASLRWVARSVGCCGLQPIARRRRPIWTGW
jgi:hypothetical protein